MNNSLKTKLKKIKCIMLDVDGVLTDGKIIVGTDGVEYKNFSVKDGVAIYIAEKAGLEFAIISGRYSKINETRAKEFRIKYIYQDLSNKLEPYEKIKIELNLKDEEICFIGDDLIDIPVMQKCGFSAAPNDACKEVKKVSDFICKKNGGEGCVREIIEILLKIQGKWQECLNWYLNRENKNIKKN